MAKNQIISVYYQSIEVGKLGYDEDKRKASFQYNPKFVDDSFKNLFPFLIRKTKNVQLFDQYSGETFRGLPPVIADSLPDMFGNIVFKEWFEANNKEMSSISSLEQLTYVGCRGMGALEYMPVKEVGNVTTIDIQEITDVVKKVMDLKTSISEKGLSDSALLNIFKIGTSAGGARPKILVAEHKITGELIPGDRVVSEEYHHYLIKLDIDEKAHYSKQKIEYIYYQIATNIGIEMMPSKLVDDKHFATHRFDRQKGEKQHVLTASGMTGWDFTKPDNSSYNNLFKLALALKLPHKDIQMLFKRMVFNIVFANIDDHLKNFSFIYNNPEDRWNLAPAYDLTYPLDALLNYTRVSRAMSVNGKRADITREDLMLIAEEFSIKEADKTIEQVNNATALFSLYSAKLQIPNKVIDVINKAFIIL
ncbi:type II toxin-antitoxin system HipA family toxin [Myroides marinus]|uniref:type II toxin-antitoxin system HipA family toxin n=1 Tax=Myroides marinus TaxID=703342 RepID=UPI00257634DA|nr:type II toxin-antitoxin system HipA family toxin [Myroides marinus]MDM1368307.1 type II toxin-antitoxin system HipA family toxin [Myroides marinus]